jgi:hypothetical protein
MHVWLPNIPYPIRADADCDEGHANHIARHGRYVPAGNMRKALS